MLAADTGYGNTGQVGAALDERGIAYNVQVTANASVHTADAVPATPAWSGQGRPPTSATLSTPDEAVSLAEHVTATGRDATIIAAWR